jgi:hypothetical protein
VDRIPGPPQWTHYQKVARSLVPFHQRDAGLDLLTAPTKTVGYGDIYFYFQLFNNFLSDWTERIRDTVWVWCELHGLIAIQTQNGTALSTHRYLGKKVKTWPGWPNLIAFYTNAGLPVPVIYNRNLNPLGPIFQSSCIWHKNCWITGAVASKICGWMLIKTSVLWNGLGRK